MSNYLQEWQIFVIDTELLGLKISIDEETRTLHLRCPHCHFRWTVAMHKTDYASDRYFAQGHATRH